MAALTLTNIIRSIKIIQNNSGESDRPSISNMFMGIYMYVSTYIHNIHTLPHLTIEN